MDDICILTWKGIGKSLYIKTKRGEEQISKQTYLENLLNVLNTLSKDRGLKLKCSFGEKGVFKFIMFKTKKKRPLEYLMLHWHGNKSRVEIYPPIPYFNYQTVPELSDATLENMLQFTELLKEFKWKLRCLGSTKGVYIWTFSRKRN